MGNETINNLLSGFIGALILFLLQNGVEQYAKFRYRRRTKFLVKIYLRKLKKTLADCTHSTIEMTKQIDAHRRKLTGTLATTYVGGEDINSSILKDNRFRDYIENHFSEEDVLVYYKLCDFLDHIARETPHSRSARYSLVCDERNLDEARFKRESDRILFQMDGCIESLQLAHAMCEQLSNRM